MGNYEITKYNNSTAKSLYEIYKNPSYNKRRAAEYWERIREQYNGFEMRYKKDTSEFFQCGFLFVDEDTGAIKLFWAIRSGHAVIVDF